MDLVLLDVHFDIPEAELLPEDKRELFARDGRERAVERLRRTQGLRILDRLRSQHPDLPVVVMTSHGDLPLEADAERLRAEDYTYLLDEDYLDARSLRLQIEGILARRERGAEPEDEGGFYWGRTAPMQALRRRLAILARGRLPIILQGATGTGKSLVARTFIHPHSHRKGPFVAVDLSTLPTDLMAAHLFGVVKGAFTGADATRPGVLDRADGGTLFLDEIGNLSLELQKQLLLVLQEGRFRAVGSVEERATNVKLVVATNLDLRDLVASGAFREDLYMRLNPATAVTLPGLVERRDEFSALVAFFLGRVTREAYNRDLLVQYCRQRGLRVPAGDEPVTVEVGDKVPERLDARRVFFLIHPASAQQLRSFDWPGNFRQFEMTLSNLVTLTLVDLVERAELVEPQDPGQASRPDVIPIQPKVVRDLLRPMERRRSVPADASAPAQQAATDPDRVLVRLARHDTLNAVSCDVERQYLRALYLRHDGDVGRVAEQLLGDPGAGRKIQLRMNQLGIRLRDLKKQGGA